MTTPTPEMKPTQVAYHKRRVNRILDNVAIRVILKGGKARVATTEEIAVELGYVEIARLIRSAHALAAGKE